MNSNYGGIGLRRSVGKWSVTAIVLSGICGGLSGYAIGLSGLLLAMSLGVLLGILGATLDQKAERTSHD